MIDYLARKKNALALRRLVSRRITNFEYENLVDVNNEDEVNWQVFHHGGWVLYSDAEEQYVDTSKKERKVIARWILFLHSENEYEWPYQKKSAPAIEFMKLLFRIISLGLFQDTKYIFGSEKFRSFGDFECWPFISKKSYKEALIKPFYFIGKNKKNRIRISNTQ